MKTILKPKLKKRIADPRAVRDSRVEESPKSEANLNLNYA